jgi:hypothetical protein
LNSVSLFARPGYAIVDGSTFTISDGVQTFTFEFEDVASNNGLNNATNVAIPFDPSDSALAVAQTIRDTINAQTFDIDAISPDGSTGGLPASEQVDLIGIAIITEGDTDSGVEKSEEFEQFGSANQHRAQGQLIIQANQIAFTGEYGIIYEDAYRDLPTYNYLPAQPHGQFTTGDYIPHAPPVRNLIHLNDENLAPGVTIANNVVADAGRGGIHVSGDPNGIILIAPTVGPANSSCEAWDEDTFVIFDIPDSQVDENRVFFEFDFNNDGLVNVNTIPVVLPIPTPSQDVCTPDGSSRAAVATAIETAIRSSNLDVQTYRGKSDEIFIEGATALFGVVNVAGNPPYWPWPNYISDAQIGDVPFARIVNNTVVGHGGELFGDAALEDVGILIDENASPTMLNNVLANLTTGIHVDGDIRLSSTPDFSSQSTIVGSSIYRDNVRNVSNVGIGDFSIELNDDEPLFVEIENGNFYPHAGSRLIDSSVDSLEDRPDFVDIRDPLGINLSPVLAPILDVTGLLRVDDPDVEPPEGFGRNVFKDRGAIDRADFDGPTAELVSPRDNDEANRDVNPESNKVQTFEPISTFVIQLNDRLEFATSIQGTGADPNTVTSERVILTRDGEILDDQTDYRFSYNPTIRTINLTSTSGVWSPFHEYNISLNEGLDENGLDASGDPGIRDLAENLLRPNQPDGSTQFSIVLGNAPAPGLANGMLFDFGDAGPGYPTTDEDNGAKHQISSSLYLGSPGANNRPNVDSESNGKPSIAMDADLLDEGIKFAERLRTGRMSTIVVTAQVSADNSIAFVDGWIDFNNDGDWDDEGEHVLVTQPVISGEQEFTISVPDDAHVGDTAGRFRISEMIGLTPLGDGGSGEVEDHLITIRDNFDYGDADVEIPEGAQEARHRVDETWFLGGRIDADDMAPRSSNAEGDGSDDDGIRFGGTGGAIDVPEIEIGRTAIINVTASQDGYLNAWIDMNGDGTLTASEQILSSQVDAGTSTVLTVIPDTGIEGITFARFRYSSSEDLGAFGEATEGEIEDYQVNLVPASNSWHFAPDPTDVQGAGDGASPLDALLVITELTDHEFSHPITGRLNEIATPPPYFDVNNDGFVSPMDALLVISQLDINAAQRPAAPLAAALPVNVDEDPSGPSLAAPESTPDTSPVQDRVLVRDLVLRSFDARTKQRRILLANQSLVHHDRTSEATIDSLFAEIDSLRKHRGKA